jgi:hypothetical protein
MIWSRYGPRPTPLKIPVARGREAEDVVKIFSQQDLMKNS